LHALRVFPSVTAAPLAPRPGMQPSFWVASTKPDDRGPEAGMHCRAGRYRRMWLRMTARTFIDAIAKVMDVRAAVASTKA
jgi:hypothetical protein